MISDALPGLVKIGRSHDPQQRASDLHSAMPFYIEIYAVFWGKGTEEKNVHNALRLFKLDRCPGKEWFVLQPKDAIYAVAKALEQSPAEPPRD